MCFLGVVSPAMGLALLAYIFICKTKPLMLFLSLGRLLGATINVWSSDIATPKQQQSEIYMRSCILGNTDAASSVHVM